MNEKKLSVGLIIFNIIFFSVISYFFINFCIFFRCLNYSESLHLPENYEILRLKIYGTSEFFNNEAVSANISILNTDGVECAVIERSWNGTSIAIDFFSGVFWGKEYFFPKKVYGFSYSTEKNRFVSGRKGTSLLPYYLENNECLLLGNGYSDKNRDSLYLIAKFSFSKFSSLFGSFFKKYVIDLSRCEIGKVYSVIVSHSGKIILSEN